MASGTCYAQVHPYNGDTYYNLSLRGEIIIPPDFAGNSTTAAWNIGTLGISNSIYSDWVGGTDINDYYRFSVGTRSNFSLSLTNFSADTDLELLDGSGSFIFSSVSNGSSSESITRQLSAGTYYVRVYSDHGDNSNYNLSFSGIPLSNPISPGGNVNLWLYDTNGRNTTDYINPNKETFVVIHGWNNNDQTENINKLAREAAEFGNQVIALDWSSISQAGLDPWSNFLDFSAFFRNGGPINTAQWVTPVANSTINIFRNLGINADQLDMVGHSLGAYIASEIGRMYGQVKNIVALDPAWGAFGYDLDINTPGTQAPVSFDSVAQYSLAFVVGDDDRGVAGDNNLAATAHDSFIIRSWSGRDTVNPIDTHGGVIDIFRNTLARRLLSPNNLATPNHQNNWYDNDGNRDLQQWDNGQHEGYINASWVNNEWQIGGLKMVIDSSGTEQWQWT